MATQRYISTSFWDDKWVQSLDPAEKLLYLYLMTNPLTNIAGVYKLTKRRMIFDTGFNGDTVETILGRFEKDGKAYLHGEYVIIPKWPKHQKWEKRTKIRDGIISELQEMNSDILSFLERIGYEFDLDLVHTTIIAKKNRAGISGSMKKRIIEKAEHKCERCGKENVDLFLHHIKPLKAGGSNSEANLQALCAECHREVRIAYVDVQIPYTEVPNYSDSDSDLDLEGDSDSEAPSSRDSGTGEDPFAIDDDEELPD